MFTKDWDGLVLIPKLKGINVVKEDEKYVYVQASAGEIWDEFVRWCVKNDYAGIENMVMIPGTVGGGVSQNIGAYGQEISKVVEKINILDIKTFEEKVIKPEECGYGYRKSNFKNIWQNKYLITSTIFKLTKHTKELLKARESSKNFLDYCKNEKEQKCTIKVESKLMNKMED